MKRWIPIIVVLRFWLLMIAASAFPEYPLALPCPSDPSLFGYTSILDLNTELRRHASALAPPLNRIPTEEFRYRLCPQTSLTVNASHSLLLPPELLLHQPIIQCGRKGDSLDRCIIQGGKTQVLLLDDWSNSTQRQSIDFLGISFQGSHNISIAALSTKTTVRFIDCHWKNIQGRSAIMMAKARALAWPQVPQPTFILEDHNIFASRRLESIGLTMDLLCQRCSFQVRSHKTSSCPALNMMIRFLFHSFTRIYLFSTHLRCCLYL